MTLLPAPRTEARPRYAQDEEKPCSYCHVNPAGGGTRNYRGTFYGQNNRTFVGFEDGAEAKKVGVAVGPDAEGEPKSLRESKAALPADSADPKTVQDLGTASFAGIEFVKLPAGAFRRGTDAGQTEPLKKAGMWTPLNAVETPARPVKITKPFFLSKTEVTQAQWAAVMGKDPKVNPSAFKGPELPVDSVSYWQAEAFCKALSQKTGAKYRLPTEAEWEYAARAGSEGAFPLGADKSPMTPESLPEYAWFSVNAENKTKATGTKKPNAWGLHDMSGNVWEWCEDAYSPTFYASSPDADPVCRDPLGTERVLRGGCWFLDARALRVALRGGNLPTFKSPYVGLRVVREMP